jgi:DNA-binding NarL/FixJ family response regulator
MSQSVVLVGHCGVDGPRLQREISASLPGVDVRRVNSPADLEQSCRDNAALLLVNREPVGFDEDGIDIVRRVVESCPDTKVMLISDHDDAQQAAVRAGALPGFGKRLMGTPELGKAVQQALAD